MRLAAISGALLLLLLVPAAAAVSVERYPVQKDGDARSWPAGLSVVVTSPAEYEYDYLGAWIGPEYWASQRRTLGGRTTMGWSVDVRDEGSPEAAMAAYWVHNWIDVERGSETVERLVGGRSAPGLPGTWILRKANYQQDLAQYEGAVAFDICGRYAVARFSKLTPSGDSAGGSMGFGEYHVKGSERPSAWNRAKVLEAIAQVRLEGNLPAARVTAARSGRVVSGRATDCKASPVAGARVVLERRAGLRWVAAGAATTSATGTYAKRVARAGVYRAVLGGRRSPPVRVR